MSKTVVILAAGKGTRVAQITNGKNKCIIPLGSKTAAEHILSHFSEDDRVIIVLNHEDTYSESFIRSRVKRDITFVYSNRQQGPGDSLYSAKELLMNTSFILWYCDTILNEALPNDFSNEFIICSNQYQENYSKYMIVPENEIVIDKSSNSLRDDNLFYIGLSYIHDSNKFWEFADANVEVFKKLCDIAYMNSLKTFTKYVTSQWYDVGNESSYIIAQSKFCTDGN